jgi:hypothetical protein
LSWANFHRRALCFETHPEVKRRFAPDATNVTYADQEEPSSPSGLRVSNEGLVIRNFSSRADIQSYRAASRFSHNPNNFYGYDKQQYIFYVTNRAARLVHFPESDGEH